MLIFKEQIDYLDHLVSGTSILPLANKIEALMKLKPPTNIKEIFLDSQATIKIMYAIMQILHILNCLMHKSKPFDWTPKCQSSFDVLHSQPANTPIVQLTNPSKPYLLFTDASKFCYSDILTQAPTKDSNEALVKILTSKDPLDSIASQTQDLRLESNIVHPLGYISVSFNQSQCRWPAITKECFSVFMPMKTCSFYVQNTNLLVHSDQSLCSKFYMTYRQ